jgi:hypothetical protein
METKKPNSLIKNILAGLLAILMIIGIKALTYRPRSGDREQERERAIAAGKKWLEKMESPEAKKIRRYTKSGAGGRTQQNRLEIREIRDSHPLLTPK